MNELYKTLAIVFLFVSSLALGQEGEINIDKDKTAINGYDLISYYTESQPVVGLKSIKSNHLGATYYFSSQKNKERFDKNPEKYLPEYGGWCAYAMGARGHKVSINPQYFSIENNKLYLFYKKGVSNTLKRWQKNPEELKEKANSNWSELISNQN